MVANRPRARKPRGRRPRSGFAGLFRERAGRDSQTSAGRLQCEWVRGHPDSCWRRLAANLRLRTKRAVSAAHLILASSAGTAAAAAMAAALAVLGLGAVWLVLSQRTRHSGAEQWLSTVVADLESRIDSMQREMGAAVERAQEEGRRSRHLGEVGGSIDLDEVLRRTLDASGATPGVDAAAISVVGGNGERTSSHIGLTAEEVDDFVPPVSLPGTRARAIHVEFESRPHPADAAERAILHGLAVPVST